MSNDAKSRGNRFWLAFAVAWVGMLGIAADSFVVVTLCFLVAAGLLLSTVDRG